MSIPVKDQKYVVLYTKEYKCYCVEYELAKYMTKMPIQMHSDDFIDTNIKFVTALDITSSTMKKLIQWLRIYYKEEFNADKSGEIMPDVLNHFEKAYSGFQNSTLISLVKGANHLGLTAFVLMLKRLNQRKLILKCTKQIEKDNPLKSSQITFTYMPLESMFEAYKPTNEEKMVFGADEPNNSHTFCKNITVAKNTTEIIKNETYDCHEKSAYVIPAPEKEENKNILLSTRIDASSQNCVGRRNQHQKIMRKRDRSSQKQSNSKLESGLKQNRTTDHPSLLYNNESSNMTSICTANKSKLILDPEVLDNIIRLTKQLKTIGELYKQKSRHKHRTQSKINVKTQTDLNIPLTESMKKIYSSEKPVHDTVTSGKYKNQKDNSDTTGISQTTKVQCLINNKPTDLIKCHWCEKTMAIGDLNSISRKITDDDKLQIDRTKHIKINHINTLKRGDDDDKTIRN